MTFLLNFVHFEAIFAYSETIFADSETDFANFETKIPDRLGRGYSHLQAHTRRSAQCRQDRTRDRCNQLHNKLSCLFLGHNFLLSFLPFYLFTFNLILGGSP